MRNSIPEVFRCISLMLKPRVGFVNPGFCSRHGIIQFVTWGFILRVDIDRRNMAIHGICSHTIVYKQHMI